MYIFKNNCKEKVLRALYGTTRGPIFIPVFMTVIISTFLLYAFAGVNVVVAIVLFILCYVVLMYIFASRRMGLGLTSDGLVYMRLRLINQKPKEVIVIPFERIKFLDVKKFLFTTNIKMSYINDDGKFKRLGVAYNPFVIGFMSQQEMNGNIIRERLQEIQKVLDRGDF